MSVPTVKKRFLQRFHGLTTKRSEFEVFQDFCEVAMICCHQAQYNQRIFPKDQEYEKWEQRYMEYFVPTYGRDGLTEFAKLFGEVQLALGYEQEDFLGSIYEELELFRKRKGQFFTPKPIATFMAKISFDPQFIEEQVTKKGFITIADPACGGGRLLMAAATEIRHMGFEPREVVYFEATDIDWLCCCMSYVQLSLLGLMGVVIHGNSLSQERWEILPTPQLQLYYKRDQLSPAWKLAGLLAALELEENKQRKQTEASDGASNLEQQPVSTWTELIVYLLIKNNPEEAVRQSG